MTPDSDGNIRYFEYAHDKFEFLSEYKSADPQRGVAFIPKRGINTHDNEVMRAFKTVNDAYIEPISFIVPRRAEVFQDDIYPPVVGSRPAMSSKEWVDGKDGLPAKIDLSSVYAGEEPTEIPTEKKAELKTTPSPQPPPPMKKNTEPTKEASQPQSMFRGPPPSLNEQTSSIVNLASKFADKDDTNSEDENDDTSSFEEVPEPVDRSQRNVSKAEDKSETTALNKGIGAASTSYATPAQPSQPASSQLKVWSPPSSSLCESQTNPYSSSPLPPPPPHLPHPPHPPPLPTNNNPSTPTYAISKLYSSSKIKL